MIALVTLALASAPVPPPITILGPRTIFKCGIDAEINEQSQPVELKQTKQFAFLLAGTLETSPEMASVEVYDPGELLDGRAFKRFVHGQEEGSYSWTTGPARRGEKMAMVEFKPLDGKPAYELTIGEFGPGGGPHWLGYCVASTSEGAKREFDALASGGAKQ